MNGGDIFKLSRILGHSSVAITEKIYAHLRPDAHAADDSRVSFSVPEVRADKVPAFPSGT
jgi:hypothetical protein